MRYALLLALTASTALADSPRPNSLPTGKWNIEFSNGIVEKVVIRKDGTATVSEPNRISDGKVTAGSSFLFVCEDGRIERWTPVGRRMVVEHWASSDQFPNGTPVRGIAVVTD